MVDNIAKEKFPLLWAEQKEKQFGFIGGKDI